MIEKYYDGAIEQVAAGLGTVEKNYLLVRYSGQFSVENLMIQSSLRKMKTFSYRYMNLKRGRLPVRMSRILP